MIRAKLRNVHGIGFHEVEFVGKVYEMPEFVHEFPPPLGRVTLPGGKVEVFTVEVLAECLERSPHTIKWWEKTGMFPAPVYVLPYKGTSAVPKRSKRLYSATQVVNLSNLYRSMEGHGGRWPRLEEFLVKVCSVFYKAKVE